ncbi:PREDICTED: mothers against decapentaplegic homolog 9-like [Rhagoletis zephyria]|uniref:mothers against decapentaplegic homolog 9-like n=1 Tax=Rhagoletis zephyria TaxID=28612 RepID=UPI0008113B16|nr:PREDICTED: mothers against decapentaplegic homolog 9-like [Rhagoletis zephyria]KAH9406895.1 Mothers against decapentaplegic 9 [Tyrophagus putrescentiae]
MFEHFNIKSMLGFEKKTKSPKDPNVKMLLAWKQGDQSSGKWAERAVKELVKRLSKSTDGGLLTKLVTALASGDEQSACVPLATNVDGRIQLSYRKVLPHVVFARLWRWPDLLSHRELDSVGSALCSSPYEKKTKAVCINPYHYRRKGVKEEKAIGEEGFGMLAMPPNVTVCSMEEAPPMEYFFYPVAAEGYSDPPVMADSPPDPSSSSDASNGSPPEANSKGTASSPAGGDNGIAGGSSEDSPEINFVADKDEEAEAPTIDEPSFWCKISYFELSNRVGPIFSVTSNPVTVDGFTNPQNDPERISLGSLSNIHRNSTITQTRLSIAEGIRLHYHPQGGQLFVEVLFEHAIFVQSELLNLVGGQPSTTVTKITAAAGLVKIFDEEQFGEVLVGHAAADYRTVYRLTSMCTLRLSFIKGWGGAPYYRTDAVMTPCWLEIQMRRAMMRLDEVLVRMVGPDDDTDSQ